MVNFIVKHFSVHVTVEMAQINLETCACVCVWFFFFLMC